MFKWRVSAHRNLQETVSEEVNVCVENSRQQTIKKSTYQQTMGSDLRKEVNVVALEQLSQLRIDDGKKVEKAVQMLYPDTLQFFCMTDKIKQENSLYKAWIKQVKAVVQRFQEGKLANPVTNWKNSVETTLRILAYTNNFLRVGIKIENREIQLLQNLLEEMTRENKEVLNAIEALNQLRICERSKESGYFSDTTDNTIKRESSCSSIETVLAEEPGTLLVLKEKNAMYKKWIYSLQLQLNSSLSLKFIEPLKMLEALKNPAADNLMLKQEYARKKRTIQYLKDQLKQVKKENVNIYALYWKNLEHILCQMQLDKSQKRLQRSRV